MTSAERRALEPFLREVATGPVRSTAMQATALLKRFARKGRPVPQAVRERATSEREEHQKRMLQRRGVRGACVTRAAGRCEACGIPWHAELELDHFYGRAQAESIETCWMLCPACHREKTENKPTRKAWDDWFKRHCQKHGYGFRPRLTKQLAQRLSIPMGAARG